MSSRKPFIALLLLAVMAQPLSAQSRRGQTDSVVVLMNAKSLELMENQVGQHFRKAIDARFLHNNTYLVCDSALWNVDMRIINAYGNVQIIQDRTVLSSDRLDYLIDDDLAQFRGSLVQLLDKDGNTLRTHFLDYNTRDSIAVFQRGASMRDKDGQVIESTNGSYDSKERVFTFERNVNMYTDSVYVKTNRLLYHTDYDFAEFFGGLDAWKDKNMLSSESGTYDKLNDRFFFNEDVHVMSDTQEGWADSLYFDRTYNNLEMYGNVQVTDTSRNVSAVSQRLFYVDSLSQVTLEREAAVIAETNQGGQLDTVYMGADRMIYHTVPKCDISGNIILASEKRLADIAADPVATYRSRAAAPSKEESDDASGDEPADASDTGSVPPPPEDISGKAASADLDSLKIDREALEPMEGEDAAADSLDTFRFQEELPQLDSAAMAEKARLDSIAAVEKARLDSIALADSLAAERERFVRDSLASRDTSAVGFLTATGHIRMFKSDMQARCDSLEYSDLDSLARMFISPIVWNEGNRQYTSDSLTVAIRNQRMDKASLMSNAFIIIQEDTICFDQIRGTEIMAYFDSTTVLERFDALGGSSALFYLKENDAFATVNKVEAKMISADFVEGEIDRISYFDSPKNDAYPLVQLPAAERELKGFHWQPESRPKGKHDITILELREPERFEYLSRPMPKFTETERYFPGHMKSIAKKLAAADSLRRVRHAEERRRQALAEQEAALAAADTLQAEAAADSLAAAPAAGQADAVGQAAEVSPKAGAEAQASAPADTVLAGGKPVEPGELAHESTPEELKAEEAAHKAAEKAARKAEAEAKRQARIDKREARWAELDARDAAKQAAKDAKALEKKRKQTLKLVIAAEKEAAKNQKKLDKYIRRYERQKERKEARKNK
ncbi:MAG: hypothetical protein IJL42_00885 [Bacteroidales bacterium]|nr:hypothetical protein [Bacteroidales bacterium]